MEGITLAMVFTNSASAFWVARDAFFADVVEELYPCRNVRLAHRKRLPMHCPLKVFFRKLLTGILKCINTAVMH